nr:homocysteine S-methyltransferase 1 [Tanacetum cinerariifolium]
MQLTGKVIVVYPNSGETWDGIEKRWLPSKCFNDDKFKVLATRWRDSGAKLVGGCCRTTPSTVRGLSKLRVRGHCIPIVEPYLVQRGFSSALRIGAWPQSHNFFDLLGRMCLRKINHV